MDLAGKLAPIVLFCYNRPWHVEQTLESLKRNTLAPDSDLFIYSDGPKKASDEPLVAQVRSYLSTLTGFRNISIQPAEKNRGLAQSVISGVSDIINRFGKIIVLEDDMLSAPDFLTFMNEALDTFMARPDVFSVSGYTPPIYVPDHYREDTYLAPRASSWGWGTWAGKWAQADWQVQDFEQLKKNPDLRKKLNDGGNDLWPMLFKQQKGVIDSWAIRWTYTQVRHNAFGLYPVRSKIKNIGTDGSGTNFTFKSAQYGDELNQDRLKINPDIKPDEQLTSVFKAYYNPPIQVRMKNWVKYRI
jgi:hypothetical protein